MEVKIELNQLVFQLLSFTVIEIRYLNLDMRVRDKDLFLYVRGMGHIVVVRYLKGVQNVKA